jgi:hypothetical protein
MKMNGLKRSLAIASACLVLAPAAFAAPQAKGAQIPNPIVNYDSYADAAKVLGYAPLYLTKDSGYACTHISLISKEMADLGFARLGQPDTTLRIRTALNKVNKDNNLSGIYGAKWEKKTVNGEEVQIAKLGDKEYAAMWNQGKYSFSVQAKGLDGAGFASLLSNSLVDTTDHYFLIVK